jgi:chromosomal replication initiation ATPase DnaA
MLLRPEDIIRQVSEETHIPVREIVTEKNKKVSDGAVRARWEIMYRIKTTFNLSNCFIGRLLNRDPKTVLYGLRKHQQETQQ